MSTPSVKVGSPYQIAFPQQARELLKIKRGDCLLVDIQDCMLILISEPGNYTYHLARLHHEIWEKSEDYLTGERDAWDDSPTS